MTVLVTGGMGYIGSHTCVELLEQGMDVVVIDNLVNSSEKAKERIEEITGKTLSFYKADVRDRKKLDEIFLSHDIDCVIEVQLVKDFLELGVRKAADEHFLRVGVELDEHLRRRLLGKKTEQKRDAVLVQVLEKRGDIRRSRSQSSSRRAVYCFRLRSSLIPSNSSSRISSNPTIPSSSFLKGA